MANNYTIKELVNKDSIRIYDGMAVIWPQSKKEETINFDVATFNGSYALNNGTLAFVIDNTLYVTPYTSLAISTLKYAGMRESNFHVPFSNGDYPKKEEGKWRVLCRKALKRREEEKFVEDCIKYCDAHNIGAISVKTLENCFQIPATGVKVKNHNYDNCYYPIINYCCLDSLAIDEIGTYCSNNGRVVFVYRDGHTYVTKGYKIIQELREAGYKERDMFVPFSNGEVIQDYILKERWDSISKS